MKEPAQAQPNTVGQVLNNEQNWTNGLDQGMQIRLGLPQFVWQLSHLYIRLCKLDLWLNQNKTTANKTLLATPWFCPLCSDLLWPVVGTYGSWGFFVTTINPPGISWQCPFDDRKLLEANWTKSCVLIMKGVGWSLWTAMSHSITIGYMSLQCLPGDKWNYVQNN